MARDPRIDAYIARQQDFARPILDHVRALVHAALPEVEEDIKWSMPAFLSKGRQFANMAAFKAHAVLGFHRGDEIVEGKADANAMGQFGRLSSVADLPSDEILSGIIRKAAALAEAGPRPRPRTAPKPELAMPADFADALARRPEALAHFDAFSPSARREYLEWVTEAKRAETRAGRIAQAVAWIAEGKKRNWKYEKC